MGESRNGSGSDLIQFIGPIILKATPTCLRLNQGVVTMEEII